MHYQTYIPHPLLRRYIKCYWSLDADAQNTLSREKVFPDGCTELIFHYGDLFRKYAAGETGFQPRSFIHGQISSFIELEASGRTGIFSVRFHPNGLKAFVPFAISATTGEYAGIGDCWGKAGRELEDRMLNAASQVERVQLVNNFLLHRLNATQEDQLIGHCVDTITRAQGNIHIEQLAAELYISRRQLEKRFVTSVGLSPKQFSRITRFQSVLALIGQRQFSSLTDLAYEGGFYDQAHFIKDFKTFTGLNPRQYFSANLGMAKQLGQE